VRRCAPHERSRCSLTFGQLPGGSQCLPGGRRRIPRCKALRASRRSGGLDNLVTIVSDMRAAPIHAAVV
jgi:hypothetical protein